MRARSKKLLHTLTHTHTSRSLLLHFLEKNTSMVEHTQGFVYKILLIPNIVKKSSTLVSFLILYNILVTLSYCCSWRSDYHYFGGCHISVYICGNDMDIQEHFFSEEKERIRRAKTKIDSCVALSSEEQYHVWQWVRSLLSTERNELGHEKETNLTIFGTFFWFLLLPLM